MDEQLYLPGFEPKEPVKRKRLVNRVKCTMCNDIIESKHRHDFKECNCKNLTVDGGLDYQLLSFSIPGTYQDLSEYENG